MSRIKIENFGPIKAGCTENDGWIEIKKVTLFIGNQGSGKSTVAKLISTLTWLEKAMVRGDRRHNEISQYDFIELFKFQRINNYFNDKTIIEYESDVLYFKYSKELRPPKIQLKSNTDFRVGKINYVPAERNYLSSVRNMFGVKNLPESINSFAYEYRNAQLKYSTEVMTLPVGNVKHSYNPSNDVSYIVGDDYKLDLVEAASGYQSYIPMYLVTKYLMDEIALKSENLDVNQQIRKANEKNVILNDATLSNDQKIALTKKVDEKYINHYLTNIVEEPELNLFPSSQQKMLFNLLEFNNLFEGNRLIMTTHSPYFINYLTLAVKAYNVKQALTDSADIEKVAAIVPIASTVNPDDLVIYQLNEATGTISPLGNYKGLPSDENYLNDSLGETYELFAQLLEIEKGWQ